VLDDLGDFADAIAAAGVLEADQPRDFAVGRWFARFPSVRPNTGTGP
jgi:hypothetical protein